MDKPIIENIVDDKGNIRRGVWLDDDNVTRLFIEPPMLTEDHAKQMLEMRALQAENARLVRIIGEIEARIDTDLMEYWRTNLNAAIRQLLEDEIAIKQLCMEALQPAPEVSHE